MDALRLAAVTAPSLSDKREWNREVIFFASQTILSERRFLYYQLQINHIKGETTMYLYNSATHRKDEF